MEHINFDAGEKETYLLGKRNPAGFHSANAISKF